MKLFKKIIIAVFIIYILTMLMLIGHTNNSISTNYEYKIVNLEKCPDTIIKDTIIKDTIIKDTNINDTAISIKEILNSLHIDTLDINNYKDPKIAGFF